ncbi:hypothetical protein SOPP22_02890 [Shewanella sp. OPT22]|nr:hypothetical protein SOPP22_02890 [Shewanella sp. OPT22]
MATSVEKRNVEAQKFFSSCVAAQQIGHRSLETPEKLYKVFKIDGGCSLYKLTYTSTGKPVGEWFRKIPHYHYTKGNNLTHVTHNDNATYFAFLMASPACEVFPVHDYTRPERLKIDSIEEWVDIASKSVNDEDVSALTLLINVDAFLCTDKKSGRINVPVSYKGRLYFFDTNVLAQLNTLHKNGHHFVLLNSENTSFSTMETLLKFLEFEIKPNDYINRLGGIEVLPEFDYIVGEKKERQWGLNMECFVKQFALDGSFLFISGDNGEAVPENVKTQRVSSTTTCIFMK